MPQLSLQGLHSESLSYAVWTLRHRSLRRARSVLAFAASCMLGNVALAEQTEAEPEPQPAPAATPAPANPAAGAPAAETAAPDAPASDYQPWPAKSILLPLEVANVDPEWVNAFITLFTDEFESAHGGRMMPPQESEKALAKYGSPGAVMEATGATAYVEGSLTRLDSKIIVSMASFDAQGRRIQREKLTAASMDDFEALSERLGQALGKGVSADQTRTLDNITDRESQPPTRIKADDLVGFRGGVIIPVANTDINTLITAALDVRFESERHFAGFAVGLLLDTPGPDTSAGYGGLTGEVAAAYYLTHTETAPYLGGGLNARILTGGANLAPYALFGLMFNRQSGAQAYLELRATQNITPIELEYGLEDPISGDSVETRRAYPFEPSLNAGVGW